MIQYIFELGTHCFWHFVGVFILLNTILYYTVNGIYKTIAHIVRGLNIRSKGWPPEHVDADGDFKKLEK